MRKEHTQKSLGSYKMLFWNMSFNHVEFFLNAVKITSDHEIQHSSFNSFRND